ncbi:MAG TPA: Dam family site-specific DNA-(adenine-N6)-methyltransferase, partial [Bacteroidetes bacterium]|nr:Dam family site-specific DNA-(adenine-N6)-methyltransferase [Bacteroidota bacterium]
MSVLIQPFKMRTLHKFEREDIVRPFLRWAGGKQRLLPALLDRLPPREKIGAYFEPFAGAASLFLAVGFKDAWLGDLNAPLINTYRHIRDSPEAVFGQAKKLTNLLAIFKSSFYYETREKYNEDLLAETILQAARFIFLNHSNFNGIYRVNKSKGHYNVPYGHKHIINTPSLERLLAISKRLENVELRVGYYDEMLDNVVPGDFVYLDPPYPVLSKTAHFTAYTIDKFSEKHHRELGAIANELKDRGANVMISSTDVPLIRELFQGWEFFG